MGFDNRGESREAKVNTEMFQRRENVRVESIIIDKFLKETRPFAAPVGDWIVQIGVKSPNPWNWRDRKGTGIAALSRHGEVLEGFCRTGPDRKSEGGGILIWILHVDHCRADLQREG